MNSNLTQQVFEFRGVDDLYVAEVLQDDELGYSCGDPIHLAPVAEVGKSTNSASESHFYDNLPLIVIQGEGDDTIQVTVAPPELERLSLIIGRSFDSLTGMMVDSPRKDRYFALMYRAKGNDGQYRYVSRLKGKFSIPGETNATEDAGTGANNSQITYTGIYTTHKFTKGIYDDTSNAWTAAPAKGIVVDTRYNLADVSNFFSAVQTPDTIQARSSIAVTGVALVPSTAAVEVGGKVQLQAVVVPANASNKAVTYSSSATGKATVNATGEVTGVASGSATITVTTSDGGFTDTCVVTVGT